MRNAARLVRAGAQAVKLEGGRKRVPVVEAICDAEIPVMGHLGLTPQSFHAMGGFKVQGKDLDAAKALVEDAHALADAGCFAIVLEGIPDVVAQLITESVAVPTIGIGAGPHCDGQVLVFHDVLGLEDRDPPKFVRRYASSEDRRRYRSPGLGGRRAQRRLSIGRRDLSHHQGPGGNPGVHLITRSPDRLRFPPRLRPAAPSQRERGGPG